MACCAKFARNNALHEYLPWETLLQGQQDFSKFTLQFNLRYNLSLLKEGCYSLSWSGTQAVNEGERSESLDLVVFSRVPPILLLNCWIFKSWGWHSRAGHFSQVTVVVWCLLTAGYWISGSSLQPESMEGYHASCCHHSESSLNEQAAGMPQLG